MKGKGKKRKGRDHVYHKCDLIHSLASLAGKILWSYYGKFDILYHNINNNPSVMKVKAVRQVLRCAPLIISKVDKNWTM